MSEKASLPIDAIEQDVRQTLVTHDTSVVIAPTGSGKSTRLPGWCYDELGVKTIVVEPRRVACRSLARYLSVSDKETAEYGYAVRFDNSFDQHTDIIFVTPGIALRWLIDGKLDGCAVVIDEFHERSLDHDLLAAILLRESERIEHLIFTSATVDGEHIADDIGARLLTSEGRTYPVSTRYTEEPAAPSSRGLANRVADAVGKCLKENTEGSILVFFPTWRTIRQAHDALTSVVGSNVQVHQVHGSMASSDIERAFAASSNQSVYLSTNVAETSLTIPGITTVIDSGLVKQRIHRGGRSSLVVKATSLASMEQRAGRAGRVSEGHCIRLFSRRFRTEQFTRPEIERVPLDDAMVKAAELGYEGTKFEQLPWITPPPEPAVDDARKRLQQSGIINGSGRLTQLGKECGGYPVSSHLAPVLASAAKCNAEVGTAVCDIIALLETGGRLFQRAPSKEASRVRSDWLEQARSTLLAEVIAIRRGKPDRDGLHSNVFYEARRVASQLRDITGVSTSVVGDRRSLPLAEDIADPFIEGWPLCVFVERKRVSKKDRYRHRSVPWTNGHFELAVDVSDVEVPGSNPPSFARAALVLDHEWVQGRGVSIRGFARTLLPIPWHMLKTKNLGDISRGDVVLSFRGGLPVISAKVHRTIGKVVLSSREEPLTGEALCNAAVDLIVERRLLKGASDTIHKRIRMANLLSSWPYDIGGRHVDIAPIDPQVWLYQRLQTLGVQQSEDLALLEVEDVSPDLEELTGIPSWETHSFEKDFPYQWEHLGAVYSVDVHPKARRITLSPVNRTAKNQGEPSPKVLPSFRGFSVRYKQASRTVDLR